MLHAASPTPSPILPSILHPPTAEPHAATLHISFACISAYFRPRPGPPAGSIHVLTSRKRNLDYSVDDADAGVRRVRACVRALLAEKTHSTALSPPNATRSSWIWRSLRLGCGSANPGSGRVLQNGGCSGGGCMAKDARGRVGLRKDVPRGLVGW